MMVVLLLQLKFNLFHRDGMALVFDSDQGERFAMTRDLSLSMEDDVIQFEVRL